MYQNQIYLTVITVRHFFPPNTTIILIILDLIENQVLNFKVTPN